MAQVPKILEDGQSDLLEHVVRVGAWWRLCGRFAARRNENRQQNWQSVMKMADGRGGFR
jgi:hypothetical protein